MTANSIKITAVKERFTLNFSYLRRKKFFHTLKNYRKDLYLEMGA